MSVYFQNMKSRIMKPRKVPTVLTSCPHMIIFVYLTSSSFSFSNAKLKNAKASNMSLITVDMKSRIIIVKCKTAVSLSEPLRCSSAKRLSYLTAEWSSKRVPTKKHTLSRLVTPIKITNRSS